MLAAAAHALDMDELAVAEQRARQAIAGGEALAVGLGGVLLAEALARRGDAPGAAEALAEGLDVLWRAELDQALAEALVRWGWHEVRAGRPEAAADVLVKLRPLIAELPALAPALARLEAVQGIARGDATAAAALAGHVAEARAAGPLARLAELLRWQAAWELHAGGPAPALAEATRLATEVGPPRLVRELAALQARAEAPAPLVPDGWALGLAELAAQPDVPSLGRVALEQLQALLGAVRGHLVVYEGFQVVDVVPSGPGPAALDAALADQVLWRAAPVDGDGAYGLPLLWGDQLVGALLLAGPALATDALARAVAAVVAHHAAGALVRLREQARQADMLAELALASRIGLAAAGAADLAALVPALAREAAEVTGADRLLVLLGDALAPAASWQTQPELPYSATIARWVHEHGRALHVLDPREEVDFQLQASVQALGGRTTDAAPIVYAGRRWGVLYSDHPYDAATRPGALAGLGRLADAVGALLARGAG